MKRIIHHLLLGISFVALLLVVLLLVGGWVATNARQSMLSRISAAKTILATLAKKPVLRRANTERMQSDRALVTDKSGYLAGERVVISGSGFSPNEVVILQVKHADGGAEPGMGHELAPLIASSDGSFSATWSANAYDTAGNSFIVIAQSLSGTISTSINRIATVATNKTDYEPGEMAIISGTGFQPGEQVDLQVIHMNGLIDGLGHSHFHAISDGNGNINSFWYVDPDDSGGAILKLTATGEVSGLQAVTFFTDAPITILDDGGADDEPGQKDLNSMTVDFAGLPMTLAVGWRWDDTAWSGNNSGDACSLYDTDGDGRANFSLCVVVKGTPATYQSTRLYSCNDNRTDRCSGPTLIADTDNGTPEPPPNSMCDAAVVGGDPFHAGQSDTAAACTVQMSDFGGATNPFLLNVCTYPSQEPNSDPSDCVVAPNSGFLTIKKNANPDDGTTFTFNTNRPTSDKNFSINGSGQVSLISFPPGNAYSVQEVVPMGWTLVSGSCKLSNGTSTGMLGGNTITGIQIQAGLETTCTFTDSKQPRLTVNKVVVPSADTGKFNLQIDGTTAGSGANVGDGGTTGAVVVSIGSHTVGETAGTGTVLSDYTTTFGGDCNANGGVTLAAGDNKTCTITNTRKPRLTVTKIVVNDNGGTKQVGDFPLFVDGGSVTSGVQNTFSIGAHTVSETQQTGYAGTIGGACGADGSVTLNPGDAKTCTITNDDIAPKLIVIKHVINDNGGTATASNFTMNVNGGSPSPASFPGAESPGTTVTLNAGNYSVTETGPDGYTQSLSADCNGSIAIDQTMTCTVTNDDIAPKLIVLKHVINDNGGTATASNFTMNVNGGSPSPASFPGAESPGTTVTLNAGSYSVGESGPSGYTQSPSTDCNGSIVVGQTKTCTITNDDQSAHLKLVKMVINDNGGTAAATNFTLSAAGPTPISGAGGAESDVNAGSYTLSETALAGYTASAWSCVGGSQANNQITLGSGQSATCTITNDDQSAHLKLVKMVTNNNGGAAATTDFTLSAAGPTPISGAGGAESDVNAGSYTLSETNLPGYTASSWSCTGGSQAGSQITLSPAQSATCTITNDDQTAHLKLVKMVTNNTGGSAAATDFTLSAAGPTPISGAGGVESDVNAGSYALSETNLPGYMASSWSCVGGSQAGSQITLSPGQSATCTITNDDQTAHLKLVKMVINNNGGTAVATDFNLIAEGPVHILGLGGVESDVDAGMYTLSETNLPGYTASAWSCVGGSQVGNKITLSPGQSATCTITNDDQTAHLKLVKMVINNNGGTAVATDFNLSAAGPTPISGAGGAESDVNAGSYALSETTLPGYMASSWSCVGGSQAGSQITLGLGQSATCTITNDDIAPKLIVIKHVINDDGKTNIASNFTMNVSGNNVIPASFPGAESPGTMVSLNAGNYSVSETGPNGYLASFSADCSGVIAVGQTKTCTVTNDDRFLSKFTDTSFCSFDFDSNLPGDQLRLLFQQTGNSGFYRLNSSNPGQFYYNVFYPGTPGNPVTLNIQVPFPFVTQGANPIQIHSSFTLTSGGCFVPSPSLSGFTIMTQDDTILSPNGASIIGFEDYTYKSIGQTTTVVVTGTVPSTGLLYVTIHLDYGLKGTTGWTRGGLNQESAFGSTQYPGNIINEPQSYNFSFTGPGANDTQTPQSINEFRGGPGAAGSVTSSVDENPMGGVRVESNDRAGARRVSRPPPK